MSRPVIVLAAPVTPELEAALDAAYDVRRLHGAEDRRAFLTAVGDQAVAAVVTGSHALSGAEIDLLPALKGVAVFGVGLDDLDVARCRERGIAVTIAPVLTDDVADLAIALWLGAQRRVAAGERFVREGRWGVIGRTPLTRRASGRRVGVFGMGRIGRAIALRAAPFASEVLYTSRREQADAPARFVADLLTLARGCEVLFLAAPGGTETRHVVDAAVLEALGPEGVLINVARGGLVDEAALVEALSSGRLGAAGLDVFENEPHAPPALLALDNVLVSPHAGSATVESRREMGEAVLANLAEVLAGRPPVSPAG